MFYLNRYKIYILGINVWLSHLPEAVLRGVFAPTIFFSLFLSPPHSFSDSFSHSHTLTLSLTHFHLVTHSLTLYALTLTRTLSLSLSARLHSLTSTPLRAHHLSRSLPISIARYCDISVGVKWGMSVPTSQPPAADYRSIHDEEIEGNWTRERGKRDWKRVSFW